MPAYDQRDISAFDKELSQGFGPDLSSTKPTRRIQNASWRGVGYNDEALSPDRFCCNSKMS
jgi:hypothetical protein